MLAGGQQIKISSNEINNKSDILIRQFSQEISVKFYLIEEDFILSIQWKHSQS